MDKYSPITVARFWSKVDVNKSRKACWEWRGALRKGYGHIKINGESHAANRVVYEIFMGEDLGDEMALHKCDNKACCNPYHIYAGCPSDNMVDMHQRGGRSYNKLSPEEIVEIRYWLGQDHHPAWLARHFGVTKSTINKIGSRLIWDHVPDRNWKPEPGQDRPTPRQENHT